MRFRSLGLLGMLLLAGCVYDHPGLKGREAGGKSTAQLLNTYWKLTQLGDLVITTPQGAREIHFVLHSENQRVAGFSGCNPLMGSYVLDGNELRFDQMGGTLMACTADMELEKEFLAMFGRVERWKIAGETLELLDAAGKPVASFESRYLE
jgi:heat shock protein HslJ